MVDSRKLQAQLEAGVMPVETGSHLFKLLQCMTDNINLRINKWYTLCSGRNTDAPVPSHQTSVSSAEPAPGPSSAANMLPKPAPATRPTAEPLCDSSSDDDEDVDDDEEKPQTMEFSCFEDCQTCPKRAKLTKLADDENVDNDEKQPPTMYFYWWLYYVLIRFVSSKDLTLIFRLLTLFTHQIIFSCFISGLHFILFRFLSRKDYSLIFRLLTLCTHHFCVLGRSFSHGWQTSKTPPRADILASAIFLWSSLFYRINSF